MGRVELERLDAAGEAHVGLGKDGTPLERSTLGEISTISFQTVSQYTRSQTMKNLTCPTMAKLGCEWILPLELVLHTTAMAFSPPLDGAEFMIFLNLVRSTVLP